MVTATWVLVIFTGILAGATVFYAIATLRLYRGSNRQVDALNELTNAIRQLPEITQSVERERKLTEELMERKIKQMTINQEKALKGH